MPGSLTSWGGNYTRIYVHIPVAFCQIEDIGSPDYSFSPLNGWPIRTPVNASRMTSRSYPHDSGPVWIATPSTAGTFTLYLLPVSRRTKI